MGFHTIWLGGILFFVWILTAPPAGAQAPEGMWRWRHIVEQAAARYGLDPDLIQAIGQHESGGQACVFNRQGSGAGGIMQLMPQTARAMGVTDVCDPVQNINGGARYLRLALDHCGGAVRCALAYYGAGPGGMARGYGFSQADEVIAIWRSMPGRRQQAGAVSQVAPDPVSGPPLAASVPRSMPKAGEGWVARSRLSQRMMPR